MAIFDSNVVLRLMEVRDKTATYGSSTGFSFGTMADAAPKSAT
jgi:hypothetical protein